MFGLMSLLRQGWFDFVSTACVFACEGEAAGQQVLKGALVLN